MRKYLASLLFAAVSLTKALEPNPPNWDTSRVKILDPNDDQSSNQEVIDAIFAENGGYAKETLNGQWSSSRYAILFKKGDHDVKVNVGFYTQVMGLGEAPTEVTLGNLTVLNGGSSHTTGALCNFWRGAENVAINTNVTWAVSQAVSLRRLHINGNLNLFAVADDGDVGYASGGFMSDVVVTGKIDSGMQQQWMFRNTEMGSYAGSNWNLVFSGCLGAPVTHCSNQGGGTYTSLWKTEIIAEKPYITERNGQYLLKVPILERDKQGVTPKWHHSYEADFQYVFVAHENNTAAEINAKIAQVGRVVFQPGIYNLTEPIRVNQQGGVLLGLGLATLVSTTGEPCIIVGDVDDVRVAGFLVQAGTVKADVLIQWGETVTKDHEHILPGVMSDVYIRCGGPDDQDAHPTSVGTMVVINRAGTIIDNTWLWRADHDVKGSVKNEKAPSDTGLVVYGDNVTAYGLMSEHHLHNLVEWYGNNGKTIMFQSEFPYDVDVDYGQKGWSAYWVAPNVSNHAGYGLGAYSIFLDHPVVVENAFWVPDSPGVQMINTLSVWIWGVGGSRINHVISGKGHTVGSDTNGKVTWVCVQDPLLYWGEGSNAELLLAETADGEAPLLPQAEVYMKMKNKSEAQEWMSFLQ